MRKPGIPGGTPVNTRAEPAAASDVDAAGSAAWTRLMEPQVLFPILILLTVGVLWYAALNLGRREEDGARRMAVSSSQELLETYEAQVVRVLREMDQTLRSLQYAYQLTGDGASALAELRERDLLPPELVFRVSIADAEGRIVESTHEAFADRRIDAGVLANSRVSRELLEWTPLEDDDGWWLRFSRGLDAPDGSFGGVAAVQVDASFFVSGYEPAKLGEHGLLGVIGSDGVFRVRRSGENVVAGDPAVYGEVVTGDGFDVTEVTLSFNRWDDVRRYTSARELYDFPLAVVVGLSEEEQLTAAGERARRYRWRALAGSVLLVLVLGALGRLYWKLENLRRRERESRIAHARHVEHLAYHDALTGLPNRSFMTRILDDRIRQSSRYGRQFSVFFLDLDGFKQINDTLGHDAGDDLLREVAKRLEQALRKSDTVARMGGDEFMVILPEIESEEQVAAVARKILRALSEPFLLLGERFRVTSSVGISLYPRDGTDEQALLKNADIAMYAAKDGGKNGFRFFLPEMSGASRERSNLEASLRLALANDEFELHYQARRDLRTGRPTALEALLRWNHPDLGTISPGKFLPLAEETGLIVPIGRWVLRNACRQSAAWAATGTHRLSVAVNLSARQFFDPTLVSDIRTILDESGLAPELLELEISESVLTRDTRKTLPLLQALKGLGAKIVVDNFGTGYSALSALGELPLDSIKIDPLFLREDSGGPGSSDVINGILAMGRVLSSSVIAHGVESKEQLAYLLSHSCDQVQGYYFGRPVRAAEVPGLLRQPAEEPAGVGSGR